MVTISLDKVDYDKAFKFGENIIAYSISELNDILEKLPASEFHNYVNENKNDIANWIEFVFENKELAHKLRTKKTKAMTIQILDEFLHKKIKNTQKVKENHNKSAHKKSFNTIIKELAEKSKKTLNKEQEKTSDKKEELKDKLKELQRELDEKLREKSKEYRKKEETTEKVETILHKYILVWLIVFFIIGLIIGLILGHLF